MKVKYMGSADIKRLMPGDDLGGILGDGLTDDLPNNSDGDPGLEWNVANRWVIDTSDEAYSAVDEDFWLALCETFPNEFRDVTRYKRVPLNMHQKLFFGMKEGQQMTEEEEERAAEERHAALMASLDDDVKRSNALAELGRLDDMSKDELVKVAKSVEVDVKASWGKEKIAEAVREKVSESQSAASGGGAGAHTSPLGATGGGGAAAGATAGAGTAPAGRTTGAT